MSELSSLSKRQLVEHRRRIRADIEKMESELEKAKTSHVLHLLLSIVTGGIWLIVWVVIGASNGSKRKKLEPMIADSKSAILDIEDQIDAAG